MIKLDGGATQIDSVIKSKHSPSKEAFDPEMDDEEALKIIELPDETIYLIDKVVRQKMKNGPIGVDNSELINIEIEQEFRQKNQYIQKLVNGGITNDHSESAGGVSQSHDNKENIMGIDNQRLLDRLTVAATNIHHNHDKSKMSQIIAG